MGGTQFFGKKAVELLINKGHQVTIATRGNKPHPFGDKVTHLILDARVGTHEGWREVTSQKWDAVFDNVCYTKEDAELLIEKLAEVTDHVFFTSSLATYSGAQDGYAEEDFDPWSYEINPNIEVTYGEGKRQAEAILYNQAPFTVTAFRFPIVLDTDDYTKRLHYYVEKALKNEPIYLENKEYKVNFVKGSTAAESIVWAIENGKHGPYNVSSKDAITLETLMKWMEEIVEKPINLIETGQPVSNSPFSESHHRYLISDKIEAEGFALQTSKEWMKPLIDALKKQLS